MDNQVLKDLKKQMEEARGVTKEDKKKEESVNTENEVKLTEKKD